MSKIILPSIGSGYASVEKLNNALQQIEDELNNKVLYRDNPEGQDNTIKHDIDMDGHNILNVEKVDANEVWVGGKPITAGILTPSGELSNTLDLTSSETLTTKSLGDWAELLATPENIEVAAGAGVKRSLADRFGDVVNVKDFGAVGDGVTDDTAAIQAAVNSTSMKVYINDGTYKITSTISSTIPGKELCGTGATIKAETAADSVMLSVGGASSKISGIVFDGNNKAKHGVYISAGGCKVTENTIKNLYSATTNALGVFAETNQGVFVTDNKFSNINSLSNSQTGDAQGASRAVLLSSTLAAVNSSVISGNQIDTIIGEEGDAIQILFNDGVSLPFLDAKTLVENNHIKDFTRRAVKVQASGVRVVKNKVENSLPIEVLGNAVCGINVIAGINCDIDGNDITLPLAFGGIQVSGSGSTYCENIKISNNRINLGGSVSCIYLERTANSCVMNNIIADGIQAIGANNSSNVYIAGNTFTGGSAGQVDISILATCSAFVIKNNIAVSGSRDWMLYSRAPNSIVIGNTNIRTVGGVVRAFSTAANTVYESNTNNSSTYTIYAGASDVDWVNQIALNSVNMGTGGGGLGEYVFYSNSIPSTLYPSKSFKLGAVAMNRSPAASGFVGWVCTSAGTPGTWKTFGVISA